ncbi:MAG: multidrug effflux MFS transporter [Clostridia bacterium]|nr:multidrug effflux MFS transporter [Clostridia bacterium]
MKATAQNRTLIILILGVLSTVSPFSIDMYLPAFNEIAAALGSTEARISLSVSSYFIGLAAGQLMYGPLLDRFGRKNPLYIGLALYVLATAGCAASHSAEQLIAFRFLQGIGGCVASVASTAMVRDFFPVKESAKIFSLLILILGVSPLFAPTAGGFIAASFGWQWVFGLLAIIVCATMALVYFRLPEGHKPDKDISLHPVEIAKEYLTILKESHFRVAAFSGAFSSAGLFVYVAGSPIIFRDGYGVGPRLFGIIFALLACGFIGGSQVNVWLNKRHENRKVFQAAVICQNIFGIALLIGAHNGWLNLYSTFALLFLFLPCAGIAYPNAAAMALEPFTRNVGSASAMLGFIQMGVGAVCSAGVALFNSKTSLPIFTVMACTSFIGLCILMIGRKKLDKPCPHGM